MRGEPVQPPNWKPVRGSRILAREAQQKEAKLLERHEKAAAKARDGYHCRWPEKHVHRGMIEAAHIQDASLCGPMDRRNLITLCAWLHRTGPESVHGKQLRVEAETALGADGPVSFWRQRSNGAYTCIAREIRPGQVGMLERK